MIQRNSLRSGGTPGPHERVSLVDNGAFELEADVPAPAESEVRSQGQKDAAASKIVRFCFIIVLLAAMVWAVVSFAPPPGVSSNQSTEDSPPHSTAPPSPAAASSTSSNSDVGPQDHPAAAAKSALQCQPVPASCSVTGTAQQVQIVLQQEPSTGAEGGTEGSVAGCAFSERPHDILKSCVLALNDAATDDDFVGLNSTAVRTEQQILIEGAATELNFRCTFGKNATTASGASFATSSSLSTTLTRTEAAALLQAAAPAQTATSLLGRDTLASTLRLGESNVIIETCLTCGDVSMPTYRVSVKISDGRNDGSRNTISVSLTGKNGKTTPFTVLGSSWSVGETREDILLVAMPEVGEVTGATLVTSGKDGLMIDDFWVRHEEAVKKEAPPAAVAKRGSKVTVLTGKYAGCKGEIEKFSASGRAKIHRNCALTATDGGVCCGSTSRTKYSYYSDEQYELPPAPPAATGPIAHESFFEPNTFLRCTGSKKAGTWRCDVEIPSSSPPSSDDRQGSDELGPNGCPICPKSGETGWQGDAPLLSSNFQSQLDGATDEVKAVIKGPFSFKFGTLWTNKAKRGVERFEYETRQDCGCLARHGSFSLAPESFLGGDGDLQQYNGRSYPKYCLEPQREGKPWSLEGLLSSQIKDQCQSTLAYDRGHMIPANHWDHDKSTIKQTNYMINIMPQMDKMNRGAWLETEMITECLRDEEALRVVGGAVYPTTPSHPDDVDMVGRDDWFERSHGVVMPTWFWKIIIAKPDGRYQESGGIIAFWMPNTVDAVAKIADQYVVSLAELEAKLDSHGVLIKEIFDVPAAIKNKRSPFWEPLEGCDRA